MTASRVVGAVLFGLFAGSPGAAGAQPAKVARVEAQPAGRVYRVGILGVGQMRPEHAVVWEAFRA